MTFDSSQQGDTQDSSVSSSSVAAPTGGAQGRGGFRALFASLGRGGQVCVIAGALITVSFFLHWFDAGLSCQGAACPSDFNSLKEALALGGSGFLLAGSGVSSLSLDQQISAPPEVFRFFWLWAVLLAGLALLALPPLMALGALSVKRGRALVIWATAGALFLELFYLSASGAAFPLLQSVFGLVNQFAYFYQNPATYDYHAGAGFGFWVAFVATCAAGLVALFWLMRAGFHLASFWKALPASGQVALGAGAAMLVLFFLPWASAPGLDGVFVLSSKGITLSHPALYSGWGAAITGLHGPILLNQDNSRLDMAPSQAGYLWLVLLSGLVLLVCARVLRSGRIGTRSGLFVTIACSVVSLVAEGVFLVQVFGLQSTAKQIFQHAGAPPVAGAVYGLSWGFWLAGTVSIVALAYSAAQLRQSRQVPPRVTQTSADSTGV
ncbi:MAG TPA: hypothetical protein VH540_03305 [Ktedonobacterales bacterium]|jgi:hypothetical protein